MIGRSNLHRNQHWQLAERQRYLRELESLGERLAADVERLRVEIEQAGGDADAVEGGRVDPLFIRPLIDRREKLLRSVAEVEVQLVEARAAVAASQQEVKLVEGAMVQRGLKFEERLTRRSRRSI